MDSPPETALISGQSAFQTSGAAVALLDAEGTVVAWTQAAQRLVGYSATEVVGRSAAVLLSATDDRAAASAFSGQSNAQGDWVGFAELRHRDGRRIDVCLSVSSLSGQNGLAGWVVSATDKATPSSRAADGSVVDSLHTALHRRLPIGVVIRDTQLRCTWVNDTQGFKDGIPLHQRLGRRLTEAAPGPEGETLEKLEHRVLESGAPAIRVEYRAFLPTKGYREPTMAASVFRLDDAEGRALGVCVVSFDVTDSRQARERLAILGEASKRIGTTLDVMRTGQELADLAVPLLADFATVDLADSIPLGEEPLARLAWGLTHLVESTQLIVSELVTNAIRYGTGTIGLRLIRDKVLTCEVSDTSNSSPRLRHPGTTDENGRGLLLISQLSHRWGTRCTPDGKLIWAEQQLTPS